MRHRLIVLAALILTALFALQNYTHAVSRLTDDLAELVRAADGIVDVEVLSVEPNVGSNPPSTLAICHLKHAYKGSFENSILTVQILGGSHGETTIVAPGQARLSIGDNAVLLLSKNSWSGKNWYVVGGDAGQFNLLQDHQSSIQRAAGRFLYYHHDKASISGYRCVDSSSISLNEFTTLLNMVIRTGRPVIEAEEQSANVGDMTDATVQHANQLNSNPVQSHQDVGFIGLCGLMVCLAAWAGCHRILRNLNLAR